MNPKAGAQRTQDREAYFGPEFFRFLRDLAQHNDRTWFQENKDRYERSVLGPSLRFIEVMGPPLARLSSHVVADPRPFGGSLFRIYRDTRFSRDKSPYKTNVGIHFYHDGAGGPKAHLPGFYLHLAPGDIAAYSGMWRPEAVELERIRAAIARPSSEWKKIRAAGILTDGESFARVPRNYPPDHPFAVDLRRKDFFASQKFTEAQVTSEKFPATFLATCRRLDPLNRFLAGAIGLDW